MSTPPRRVAAEAGTAVEGRRTPARTAPISNRLLLRPLLVTGEVAVSIVEFIAILSRVVKECPTSIDAADHGFYRENTVFAGC
jgi:hypothetical protein